MEAMCRVICVFVDAACRVADLLSILHAIILMSATMSLTTSVLRKVCLHTAGCAPQYRQLFEHLLHGENPQRSG